MTRRNVIFFFLFLVPGSLGLLIPGNLSVAGNPSLWASRAPLHGSGAISPDLGPPLPDRDIELRATGIGVYPIQIHPGMVLDEGGPVKLWDEVSLGGSREAGTPPPNPRRTDR